MQRIYIFLMSLLAFGGAISAQTPELVTDLNTGSSNGLDEFNTSFLRLGNKTVLIANNGQTGLELYVLENNTLSLLKDIAPGSTSSQPEYLTLLGDKIYFVATDSVSGRELWVTDGTNAGTALAQDLLPGTDSGNPRNLISSDAGVLFFERNHKIYSMVPGAAPVLLSVPYVNLDQDYNSLGNNIVKFKNGVAFAASPDMFVDSTYVWVSDGVPSGTRKVAAYVGSFSGGIFSMLALNDKVLFVIENGFAPGNSVNGIYAVSGLPGEPAVRLLSAAGSSTLLAQRLMAADGNTAYFYTQGGMYVTDGTVAGTVKLTGSLQPYLTSHAAYPFAFLQGQALFQAEAGSFSSNIYKSNGTVAGTAVLKTIDENFVEQLVRYRDKIFFVSGIYNSFTPKIWESNLTDPGTKSIYNYTVNSASGPSIIILGFVDDYLYYQSNLGGLGRELYRLKVSVGVSTHDQESAALHYSMEYNSAAGEYRIIGEHENERLSVDLFDVQGRAIQHLSVNSGETFRTTPLHGAGVLVVQGLSGRRAFKVIGH